MRTFLRAFGSFSCFVCESGLFFPVENLFLQPADFEQAFCLLWKVFCTFPSTQNVPLLLSSSFFALFSNKTNICCQLKFQLFYPFENWIAHLMSTVPFVPVCCFHASFTSFSFFSLRFVLQWANGGTIKNLFNAKFLLFSLSLPEIIININSIQSRLATRGTRKMVIKHVFFIVNTFSNLRHCLILLWNCRNLCYPFVEMKFVVCVCVGWLNKINCGGDGGGVGMRRERETKLSARDLQNNK